jgi:hypothetical protein
MEGSQVKWIARRAMAVAVLITAVMALCGTLSNLVRPLAWLSYVSRGLAFLPSLIVRHLVSANPGSMAGAIALEIEGVAFCFIFYALIAALVLWLVLRQDEKNAGKT